MLLEAVCYHDFWVLFHTEMQMDLVGQRILAQLQRQLPPN